MNPKTSPAPQPGQILVSEAILASREADLAEKGDQDVRRKIRQDFDQKGVNVTDAELTRAMGEFLASAVATLEAEAKKG